MMGKRFHMRLSDGREQCVGGAHFSEQGGRPRTPFFPRAPETYTVTS